MKFPVRFVVFTQLVFLLTRPTCSSESAPVPAPWPDQFHALIVMNFTDTGKIEVSDNYYDWKNGRNINIMQAQLGEVLHNVEWNNGTSFYYTLGQHGSCDTRYFGVGITRPDFLSDGASYLGQETVDGFLCNVWMKLDFLWYYEDVVTKKPVRWDFFTGIINHVITFEVGAVLEDARCQAPAYCFKDGHHMTDEMPHRTLSRSIPPIRNLM